MTRSELLRRVLSSFSDPTIYEQDPGFRDVILRHCRRGMYVIGILSLVAPLANIGAHLAAGYDVVVRPGDPESTIFLWDRVIVMVLGTVYLVLGRTRWGPRWGRFTGAILVLVVGLAMLFDEIVQGGPEFFSSRYLGLVMLFVIALMPYKPWQALVLVVGVWGVYLLGYWNLPVLLQVQGSSPDPGVLIYILLVMLLCIGLSTILYNNQYDQYRARRIAEQLRERVEEQAEKLVALQQMKARFFANISHEFRTPLTLILGPVDDALDDAYGPLTDAFRRQLHVMQRSGRRLQRLINQLLDLSKLEAERMTLDPRRRDLIPFLRRIVGAFSSLADRKGIALQFHSESASIPFSFDDDKLEKVVTNLLSNAFKFTPDQGTVRVSVRETRSHREGYVEISVRDSGPGISPEELPYVFDRFHQVGRAAGREAAGTGIGLALAKELVELHRGQIRVESEPGFGCEFVVQIPLAVVDGPAAAIEETENGLAGKEIEDPEWTIIHDDSALDSDHESVSDLDSGSDHESVSDLDSGSDLGSDSDLGSTEPSGGGKPKVLIVDDNADVRRYVKSHLTASYQVLEAADGEEAMARARETIPDLLISDVMMPKMDGVALCRALKTDEHLNHIPVILLTARADEESKIEGLKTGADDYLTKPFNAKELVARVENLIEIRRLLRERFSDEVMIGPSEIVAPSAEAQFVERVRMTIERHMADSNFGVEWLADEAGISVRHLGRRLKAATGLTPGGYVRMMRLERAKQLLAQHAGTVSEIAYRVGFQDPGHFSRLFKQTVGVLPSEYRSKRP